MIDNRILPQRKRFVNIYTKHKKTKNSLEPKEFKRVALGGEEEIRKHKVP